MKIKDLLNSCMNQWKDDTIIYDYNFEVELRNESKGTFYKSKWFDLRNDDYYIEVLRHNDVKYWEMPTTKSIIIGY